MDIDTEHLSRLRQAVRRETQGLAGAHPVKYVTDWLGAALAGLDSLHTQEGIARLKRWAHSGMMVWDGASEGIDHYRGWQVAAGVLVGNGFLPYGFSRSIIPEHSVTAILKWTQTGGSKAQFSVHLKPYPTTLTPLRPRSKAPGPRHLPPILQEVEQVSRSGARTMAPSVFQNMEPLYLPPALLTDRAVAVALRDMVVCLLLFLAKRQIVPFDEDVKVWLMMYLRNFRKIGDPGTEDDDAQRVSPVEVLDHLLRHYRWTEDYRGFRQFVGRTIQGLLKTQRRRRLHSSPSEVNMEDGLLSLERVVQQIGIPRSSLYYLIKTGRVQTVRRGGVQHVERYECERLEREWKMRGLRKILIESIAKKRGSSVTTARRLVAREETKGLTLELIGRARLTRTELSGDS